MKKLMILALAAVLASSCADKAPIGGNVTMKASAVSASGKTSYSGRVASTVIISDFKINISKIKFEIDEDDARHATNPTYEDIKLNGPFLLDLLDPDKTLNQIISSVTIPNGKYEEIEFKFEKSTVAGDMLGKTLLIKGTIDGKDFVVWSGKDAELEMDFSDATKDFAVNGNDLILNIKLKLDGIMAALTVLAKQGLLLDTDGDGVIEITTDDDDGHHSIGEQIRNLLESETDLDDKD